MQTNEAKKKQGIALLTIGMSVIALILGFLMRTPIYDSFSIGGWIGFVAFLLSLGAVSDEGNNFLAKIAFFASFAAMCVAIFLGAA